MVRRRRPPRGVLVALLWCATFAGCDASSTRALIDLVVEEGAPTPDALVVSAFDPSGRVGARYSMTSPILPGQLGVRGLAADQQVLRLSAIGTGTTTVSGALRITLIADQEVRGTLLLVQGLPDRDGDEVLDDVDNCPDVANADQADLDANGTGDACEGAAIDLGAEDADAAEPIVDADAATPDDALMLPDGCDPGPPPVDGAVIYVREGAADAGAGASPADPMPSLQAAFDKAKAMLDVPVEVRVAAGELAAGAWGDPGSGTSGKMVLRGGYRSDFACRYPPPRAWPLDPMTHTIIVRPTPSTSNQRLFLRGRAEVDRLAVVNHLTAYSLQVALDGDDWLIVKDCYLRNDAPVVGFTSGIYIGEEHAVAQPVSVLDTVVEAVGTSPVGVLIDGPHELELERTVIRAGSSNADQATGISVASGGPSDRWRLREVEVHAQASDTAGEALGIDRSRSGNLVSAGSLDARNLIIRAAGMFAYGLDWRTSEVSNPSTTSGRVRLAHSTIIATGVSGAAVQLSCEGLEARASLFMGGSSAVAAMRVDFARTAGLPGTDVDSSSWIKSGGTATVAGVSVVGDTLRPFTPSVQSVALSATGRLSGSKPSLSACAADVTEPPISGLLVSIDVDGEARVATQCSAGADQ